MKFRLKNFGMQLLGYFFLFNYNILLKLIRKGTIEYKVICDQAGDRQLLQPMTIQFKGSYLYH